VTGGEPPLQMRSLLGGFPDGLSSTVRLSLGSGCPHPHYGFMVTSPPPGLRVLLLTTDPHDADLITCAVVRTNPSNTVVHVETRAAFVRALEIFEPDVRQLLETLGS
jgi:hypothetical protein